MALGAAEAIGVILLQHEKFTLSRIFFSAMASNPFSEY
jgi:hypothetical protein